MATETQDVETALHGTQTVEDVKKPRTDLDFDGFRKRLEDERKQAEGAIAVTDSMEEDHVNATGTQRAEAGESGFSNHPADAATDLFLQTQDKAMVDNAKDLLKRIDRAFAKLDEGTYGLSDHSGVPIPVERLEVLPYANLTAEEQEQLEMSGVY